MTMKQPLTRAETSAFTETSRHADVMAFIAALAARKDPRLHVTDFGATPEGRRLPLLVLSQHGHFTPEAARAAKLPVVLVICGIHAGEVEGKEGGLMLVRDILDGAHGDVLERITLVVLPLFNADGNDRIDAANRKLDIAKLHGQLGPESGVGTRVNAAGVNLNRDYMRQDASEMRLLQSRVCQPWNPHLTIDCHATNGSIHRFAMTYDVPHTIGSGRREPIDYMRERMMPAVSDAVQRKDGFDSFWYGNFMRDEGGQGTGWLTYTHHPRFGGNYRGLANRLDLLLEAYSYISYEDRVRVTYAFVREALAYAAAHGREIVELLDQCEMPPEEIAVRYRLEAFPGVEVEILTREPYALDGAPISAFVPLRKLPRRPCRAKAVGVCGAATCRGASRRAWTSRRTTDECANARCGGRHRERPGVIGRSRDPRIERILVPRSRLPAHATGVAGWMGPGAHRTTAWRDCGLSVRGGQRRWIAGLRMDR